MNTGRALRHIQTAAVATTALASVVGCSAGGGGAGVKAAGDASALADGAVDAVDAMGTNTSVDAGPPVAPCTVAANCLGRFALPGSSFQLPYYSTYPPTTPLPQIRDVVVFIHGLDRDATTDFTTSVTAGQRANQLTTTLVITPFFQALVSGSGAACTGPKNTPQPTDLVWTCDGWSDGLAATNDSTVSSYGALDALLSAIEQAFPTLERVTVSGFSAGGQFTQRYAATNTVDHGSSGPPVRYVIGDPSSYLYLDKRRPVNASNCTTAGCPDGFAPFADAGGCPHYNDWKYGTLSLAGAALNFTPAQIQAAYVGRPIEYLLGEEDDGPTAAAHYPELDVTCAANAEGPFRYQRGLAFYAYATTLFDAGPSTLATIAGCAHSPTCVFQSDAGVAAVFGP